MPESVCDLGRHLNSLQSQTGCVDNNRISVLSRRYPSGTHTPGRTAFWLEDARPTFFLSMSRFRVLPAATHFRGKQVSNQMSRTVLLETDKLLAK